MGQTLSKHQRLDEYTDTEKTINTMDDDIFQIDPNYYYYFKFYTTLCVDPTNILPKNIKLVLDNSSLQIKKRKKVYLHIPYEQISRWIAIHDDKWGFAVTDACKIPRTDNFFIFKTHQSLDISKTILSLTTYLARQKYGKNYGNTYSDSEYESESESESECESDSENKIVE